MYLFQQEKRLHYNDDIQKERKDMYILKNECLTIELHEKGAMLWSIKDADGNEYLWQGDEKYWANRAPNLFPYIGRMTEGKYTLQGQTYQMNIHGFARDMFFEAQQISDTHILFTIKNTEETYKQYPYQFLFTVSYILENNKLKIQYHVSNHDEKTMYFGVGAHPGFNVPFETNTVFEDYFLQFDSVSDAKRVEFSDDCFVSGEFTEFFLDDENSLPLRHGLFDYDAIVLTDMAQKVTLMSKKGHKGISVTYPGMKYLGLWHRPKTDAPYICIEPWSSLPSRKGIVEDLASQPSMLALNKGCEYNNQIVIELFDK